MFKWQKKKQLENIYNSYFKSIYNYVYFRLKNVANAEEITSLIFEKIINNIDKFEKRKGASIKSWVFTIARNTLIDYYRQNKENIEEMRENIKDSNFSKEIINDKIDQKIILEKVFNLIDNLPDKKKEIVLLRYKTDLSNKEIAKLLLINERSVSSTLSRVISLLKSELNKEEYE